MAWPSRFVSLSRRKLKRNSLSEAPIYSHSITTSLPRLRFSFHSFLADPVVSLESMDSFASFFHAQPHSGRNQSYQSHKNLRQISPVVQHHLKQVYLTLCCSLVASAVGAYLHLVWNMGGLLTTLACTGSIVWLLSSPTYEERKRFGLFMAASLFQGASLGPLIDFVIEFDPSILVSAFGGTAIAFGCFSAAATVAKRREYLYLGGLLSAGVSILFWLHFTSAIFGGSMAIFKFELYFGLLVFLGYVVVDTQKIIERAHLGDLDYVKHALTLFTDFAAVFVRILIILMKNRVEKSEKEKRKRRS